MKRFRELRTKDELVAWLLAASDRYPESTPGMATTEELIADVVKSYELAALRGVSEAEQTQRIVKEIIAGDAWVTDGQHR